MQGNGFNNMRTRTSQLEGEIKINSMPGKGTAVIIAL
jgi:signal transduction histidine kinase